ncbi:MAG: hypothetical protein OEY72_12140 [Gammaproteobacteria bacterium]|nr:hypothetical protein [Gammaproteobacteria bacterium]
MRWREDCFAALAMTELTLEDRFAALAMTELTSEYRFAALAMTGEACDDGISVIARRPQAARRAGHRDVPGERAR